MQQKSCTGMAGNESDGEGRAENMKGLRCYILKCDSIPWMMKEHENISNREEGGTWSDFKKSA